MPTPTWYYTPTKTNGTPNPRYIFQSYRNKKKLDLWTNSKVYLHIDLQFPRMYIG